MTPLHIFHILHPSIELALAILILYAVFFAIKRFKIVAWKKGWYVIGIGATIFILVKAGEILGALVPYLETSPLFVILLHTVHIIAFAFFAIGIFMLSKSVGKIFGK